MTHLYSFAQTASVNTVNFKFFGEKFQSFPTVEIKIYKSQREITLREVSVLRYRIQTRLAKLSKIPKMSGNLPIE